MRHVSGRLATVFRTQFGIQPGGGGGRGAVYGFVGWSKSPRKDKCKPKVQQNDDIDDDTTRQICVLSEGAGPRGGWVCVCVWVPKPVTKTEQQQQQQ